MFKLIGYVVRIFYWLYVALMSFVSQFDIFLGLCFNVDDAFLCLNDEINLTFGFIR